MIQTPAHPSMHEATKDTDGSGIVSDERRKSTPSPTWGGDGVETEIHGILLYVTQTSHVEQTNHFLTIFYKLKVERPPRLPPPFET